MGKPTLSEYSIFRFESPTGDIKTSQTVFKMSGLNKYYNSIGTCKIHLKTLSGSATISGTLSED